MRTSGASQITVLSSFILLLTYFFLILAPISATANKLSTHNSSNDMDLISFLNSKTQQYDVIFTEAVQLLESMKSAPSCNRLAATKLVTSCQSISKDNGLGSDNYVTLERIRSLYAARLAICELDGAGTSIPASCSPVAVLSTQKRSFFGFSGKYKSQNDIEDIPQHFLESCLKSLESRPQWWTSYSNSRQNAIMICQAARIEGEKEELLDLHRHIIDVTLKLNHGLEEALRTAAAESAEQKAFVHAIDTMRNRLTRELEDTEIRFKLFLSGLFHDVESSVESIVSSVTMVLGRIHTGTAALEKNVRNVSNEVDHLQETLRAVHVETLARSEQLMQVHRQDSHAQIEIASSLRSSLESLLQGDMVRLSQEMGTFDTSVEWLLGKMGTILRQEAKVSERLRTLEMMLVQSEMKAQDLQRAQLLQSEVIAAQSQAQHNIHADIQISQGLLDKVTATAANLQTMVDETATTYRESPVLGGLHGTYSAWTVCALLFSMLGAQNPKSALAVLFIGMAHLFVTRIIF
ncbi:hypothetical protein SI65_07022 [Aspergillus cristatus]|uniref:Nuclear fusion protein KAR5 n=1 Tax=Aspergillus cristatus TaxID=573508 RepID=A0A1E3B8S5_ASPCR|nr:hypothetical protein SI65_07022 [Aspergillus cristatus]